MNMTVGALNVALGAMYLIVGTLMAIDLKREWKEFGYSHFAVAFMGLAFTCGPHHTIHGVHMLFEGRNAGVLDLIAVLVGVPAGAVFVYLRVEAFDGGRGDRLIVGNPLWIQSLPVMSAVYLTAIVAAFMAVGTGARFAAYSIPNLLLIGIYARTAYFLIRTQLRNRGLLGGWSASGFSLAMVFPTCTVMHAVFVLYSLTGRYAYDVHGYAIDWVSVPAGLYFLWVIKRLYKGDLGDWNSADTDNMEVTSTSTAGTEKVS